MLESADLATRHHHGRGRIVNPLGPSLWLLLGGLFSLLYVGRWVLQPAAWLAPIFLLHFLHSSPHASALLWVWVALFIAVGVANRGVIPAPGPAYWGIVGSTAFLFALPFVADRFLAPRWSGLAATLVFPLAMVAVDYLNARVVPGGSWGSPAYSQYGDLPLVQVASVTGIHGITFLISWAASVGSWAWDRGFVWDVVGGGVSLYAAILIVILLLGAARLWRGRTGSGAGTAGEPGPHAIRVAVLSSLVKTFFVPGEVTRILQGRVAAEEREALRSKMRRLQDWFIEGTAREARAGADLVVWAEVDCMVFKEDESAFLERVRRAASEAGVTIVTGMGVVTLGAARPLENRALLIGADGEIAYNYAKSLLVMGWEAACAQPGDGRIPVADTPIGRIATAICYEMDFPWYLRQASRSRADLLVAPSNDWPVIKEIHWRMATFRAVENGAPMVRATKSGLSGAVDFCGRVLGIADTTFANVQVMVAHVPVGRVATIYARVGDLFAWVCVGALVLGAARELLR